MGLFRYREKLGRVVMRTGQLDRPTILRDAAAARRLNRIYWLNLLGLVAIASAANQAFDPGLLVVVLLCAAGLPIFMMLQRQVQKILVDADTKPQPVTDLFEGGARDFLVPLIPPFVTWTGLDLVQHYLPTRSWRVGLFLLLLVACLAGVLWMAREIRRLCREAA